MDSKHRKINRWNQILNEILDDFAGRNLFPEDIDGGVRERLVQILNSSGSCHDKKNNRWNQMLNEILDEFAGRNLSPEDIDGRVRERLVQMLNSSGGCHDKEDPSCMHQ